jgi:hypothetical protein
MSHLETANASSAEVVVQLFDAALGRTMKTWRFVDRREITIGRLPSCDIEISDPYVSRLHAELCFRDNRWRLIARGQSGIVVQNRQITELVVESQVTFQLGSIGPVLKFCVENVEAECGRTLSLDTEQIPIFALDEKKLNEEVGQITEGDYFQGLQSRVKSLRTRRA